MADKKLKITLNAPAVLWFAMICSAVTLLGAITGGGSTALLFSTRRASLLDPLTWVRCFTHLLGHAGWEHLLGNIMYILILGPMIEEKYGTATTAFIMAATALVIGVINMVFFPGVMLLGASGIVFAFILIASITIREDNTIPVTFILVAVLYLGQQIWQGLFQQDNVSQMAHIAGGAVGAGLGFLLGRAHQQKNRSSF